MRLLVLVRLRRRPLLFWAAAVLLAALTAAAVSQALAVAERWGPTRVVLVVARPVAAGAALSPDDVRPAVVPARLVPEGAAADVVGRTALVDLVPGEVVVAARLAPDGLHGVAALVPPGRRAVTVPVGDGGAPARVGDRVDLLATFEVEPEAGDPTVVVARAALVVDVQEGGVTLAVTPHEAPRVAFSVARGIVALALVPGAGA